MKVSDDISLRREPCSAPAVSEQWSREPRAEARVAKTVGRIFVVGCPRSGTTLVQSLLAAHSQVMAFTESHLFDKCYVSLGTLSILRRGRLREYTARFIQENEHLPSDAESRLWSEPQRSSRELGCEIIALLDEAAQSGDATHWVEKTPDHVFRIPLIRSLSPNARFIHVIRRAEGVLPSLYLASRQWGRNKSWLSCALHWLAAMWLTAYHARGANHFVIAYEDLLEDPEKHARAMIEWLGLDWEDTILTERPQAAAKCIATHETWKLANLQETPPSNRRMRAPLFARMITWFSPYAGLRRRFWRG